MNEQTRKLNSLSIVVPGYLEGNPLSGQHAELVGPLCEKKVATALDPLTLHMTRIEKLYIYVYIS